MKNEEEKTKKITNLIFIFSGIIILASVVGYFIGGRVFDSIYAGIFGIFYGLWRKIKVAKNKKQ